MIERYTRPEMGKIWTLENKFKKWLDIEILACEAWAELGVIRKWVKSGLWKTSLKSGWI